MKETRETFQVGDRVECNTGEWAAGTVSGEGRFEHSNGDVFTGHFADKKRVRGKLTWAATGDEYEGEMDGVVPSGRGALLMDADER